MLRRSRLQATGYRLQAETSVSSAFGLQPSVFGSRAGYTLAELLVATAVFVTFAALAFQMIVQVTRYVGEAKDRAGASIRAMQAAEALSLDLKQAVSDDLGAVNDMPVARFFSRIEQNGSHLLAFTTSFARGNERGRYLADTVAGKEFYDGLDDDGDGVIDNNLMPSDGFAEVAWFVRQRALYRAVRSPVAGSMEDLINEQRARKIVSGVLRMSLRFWGPETRTWLEPPDARKAEPRYYPLSVWDSTRGLAAVFPGFQYDNGPASVSDGADDVFPKMVEVSLILAAGRSRRAVLVEDAGADDGALLVGSTRGIPGPEIFPYLLADDEWMRYYEVAKRSLAVERGALGSKRRPHARGTEVLWGFPVHFRVFIPAGKDAYDIAGAASYNRGGSR